MMGGPRVLFVLLSLFAVFAGVTAAMQWEFRPISWAHRAFNNVARVSDARPTRLGETGNNVARVSDAGPTHPGETFNNVARISDARPTRLGETGHNVARVSDARPTRPGETGNNVARVSDARPTRLGETGNNGSRENPVSGLVPNQILEIAEGRGPSSGSRPSDTSIPASTQISATPIPSKFSITIRRPSGPPRVVTTLKDVHGSSVTVACSTCHTTRPPNHQNKTIKTLDEFHSGMAFSHGTVSCLSCHNPNDYDSLQLADGSRVDFTDVMTLCGQCHGPQMKDYEHGVHGGLNGYWDLTRGPQQKNNCVDCHNPHAPQFPKMQPTFKPKDRFLEKARSEH